MQKVFQTVTSTILVVYKMPTGLAVEPILEHAKTKEKTYDWIEAIELYRKALELVSAQDSMKAGEIHEDLGYAFFRAAMQADSVNSFREKMNQAVTSYEKADESYRKLYGSKSTPQMLRREAMIIYVSFWLASEVSEKRKLLNECWKLTKLALKAFQEVGAREEYWRTYHQLSVSALLGFFLDWDHQMREKRIREIVEYGEHAINSGSVSAGTRELAKAYARVSGCLQALGFYFLDLTEREGCYQRALGYWVKANEISEEAAMIELLESAGLGSLESPGWEWGTEKTLSNFEKTLEYGRKTKDRFILGIAFDWLGFHTLFHIDTSEDPTAIRALTEKALEYSIEAKRNYSVASLMSPLWGALWADSPHACYYYYLAAYETEPSKRRELLETARQAAKEQLKLAVDSGYPEVIMFAQHMFTNILFSQARAALNPEDKRTFLEEALGHQNEAIRIIDQFIPFYYWKRGLLQSALADIKSELARLNTDPRVRSNLLQEAISDKENSVKLGMKYAQFIEGKVAIPSLLINLGNWQYQLGNLLNRFYELTNDSELLRKAADAFEDAVESFRKAELISSTAESYWKAAQAYDALGEHLMAAHSFTLASEEYKNAARKVPPLEGFFADHAKYMQAWYEIENARHHHKRQEYGTAKEHYQEAARTHEQLRQWSYLAPNFSAWAELEQAEDLSRMDRSEEAIEDFEQARSLFSNAEKSLRHELSKIENEDEKQATANSIKATSLRHEYCAARAAIEEARILDKNGDHYSSSQKYSAAARTIKHIILATSSQREQTEFEFVHSLSQAWQKMTQAEAEASPALYIEASTLFEQAKDLSQNEKQKMLALGHSRFCKALEAGTRFADTRDAALHTAAIDHLESASNYYMKAGLQTASDYAGATGLLLDAYARIDQANKDKDPENKAKLYTIAQKLLEASAQAFVKAEHPEKREQVVKLLAKVKEERNLAESLSEVLHASPIVSAISALAIPVPTEEKTFGLERFEHANIQARLTAPEEATVAEAFEIRLDLANVAKEPALLVRIENFIPSSFRIAETTPRYEWENSAITVKGKPLPPQKVESIRIIASASASGIAHLNPRIVYIDKLGKFKTCQPEPVSVTVYPRGKFEFKVANAQKVFEYLTKAFAEDYMKRRLPLDESGWRTLMDIVKDAQVTKSSMYGPRARRGTALSELEIRGVVETRIFSEERGRGGKVTKARIAYDKEVVKRYVDEQVMKIRKNRKDYSAVQ